MLGSVLRFLVFPFKQFVSSSLLAYHQAGDAPAAMRRDTHRSRAPLP
jgi:hypothetical protein